MWEAGTVGSTFPFFFLWGVLKSWGIPKSPWVSIQKRSSMTWMMYDDVGYPHDYHYLWNLHIISHYTLHILFSTAQLSQLSRPGTIWWLCELCAAHHRQLHCQWRAEAGALVKQQRKVTMKICTPRSKLLVGQQHLSLAMFCWSIATFVRLLPKSLDLCGLDFLSQPWMIPSSNDTGDMSDLFRKHNSRPIEIRLSRSLLTVDVIDIYI